MSFDEMEYEKFSWIRWDRMRWDLVDLMVSSAAQHVDRERSFLCTGHSCCIDMQKLSTLFGFEIQSNTQDESFGHIGYREDLYELTTSEMRDGMMMVSNYIRWGSGHPLRGHSEVPWEVGRIVHSPYFTNLHPDDSSALHVSDEPSDEIRELLYAFVKLAFPNEFLLQVALMRGAQLDREELSRTLKGVEAFDEMVRIMESGISVAPELEKDLIPFLSVDLASDAIWTEQFSLDFEPHNWKLGAGHDLELGMEDASLLHYWEDWPTIPWAFECSQSRYDVGSRWGDICGFIVRGHGLFVSQQTFSDSNAWTICMRGFNWNTYTQSFNDHLAPVIASSSQNGSAMVVFSDFRGDAYIVSSVEASWDEYAPMSAVLGPLPHGFGIVGVWTNYDEARYTPRSLDEIINANWSEQITASAKYLRDCLAAVEAAKS